MYFLISFISALLLIFLEKKYSLGGDNNTGEQKFHNGSIPRTGGFALAISLLAFIFFENNIFLKNIYIPIILTVILMGIEDLKGNIPPALRLVLLFLFSSLLIYNMNIGINSLNIPGLDFLLENFYFSFIFTLLAVVLLSNGFNMIDGFNGLLGGYTLLIFLGMIQLSSTIANEEILELSQFMISIILGFIILNFPFGKIFLGDSGAFLLALLSSSIVLKLIYSSESISYWFALSVFIYPVYEVVFSIIRKKFFFKARPMYPDSFHLHMVIHRVLVNCDKYTNQVYCNSLTSLILLTLNIIPLVISFVFFDQELILFLNTLLFMFIYTVIYLSLLKIDKKFSS